MKPSLLRGLARLALAPPLAGVIGRRRRRLDGAMDRQVAAVLELERLLGLPALDSMQPTAARRYAEAGFSPLEVPVVPMTRVVDTHAAGVPVRIYVPPDASPHWIVYFHGGGGVIGSIASSEPITRLLAAQTGCTVASVEYRLGPEHRHPAAVDDAVAAWTALRERVPGRAAVAGDSFGGFLAAHVDHAAARRPDLQVLIYPTIDMTLTSPSIDRLADGYLLTRSMLHWFGGHYFGPAADRRACSPRSWDLRGAAPAIVVTAGHDPLVEEGDAYAAQLARAGVRVRHRPYPALIHGFLSLCGGVRAARAAVDELCGDVRELISYEPG